MFGLLHEMFPPGGMDCPIQSEQLSPYIQETAKNTPLPSLFDPLTVYSNYIHKRDTNTSFSNIFVFNLFVLFVCIIFKCIIQLTNA